MEILNDNHTNVESCLITDMKDLESKKFKNRLDVNKINEIKQKLHEINLEKTEIINDFEKKEQKASLKIPASEGFKLFSKTIINDLKKSHTRKNQQINGYSDELYARQNKYEEDFENTIKSMFSEMNNKKSTLFYDDFKEKYRNLKTSQIKPNYFSLFKERSSDGLKERINELKYKYSSIKNDEDTQTNYHDTLLTIESTLHKDIEIYKERQYTNLKIFKIMQSTYQNTETQKFGSLQQNYTIENKLGLETIAYYEVAQDKELIIEDKIERHIQIKTTLDNQLYQSIETNIEIKKSSKANEEYKQKREDLKSGEIVQKKLSDTMLVIYKYEGMLKKLYDFVKISKSDVSNDKFDSIKSVSNNSSDLSGQSPVKKKALYVQIEKKTYYPGESEENQVGDIRIHNYAQKLEKRKKLIVDYFKSINNLNKSRVFQYEKSLETKNWKEKELRELQAEVRKLQQLHKKEPILLGNNQGSIFEDKISKAKLVFDDENYMNSPRVQQELLKRGSIRDIITGNREISKNTDFNNKMTKFRTIHKKSIRINLEKEHITNSQSPNQQKSDNSVAPNNLLGLPNNYLQKAVSSKFMKVPENYPTHSRRKSLFDMGNKLQKFLFNEECQTINLETKVMQPSDNLVRAKEGFLSHILSGVIFSHLRFGNFLNYIKENTFVSIQPAKMKSLAGSIVDLMTDLIYKSENMHSFLLNIEIESLHYDENNNFKEYEKLEKPFEYNKLDDYKMVDTFKDIQGGLANDQNDEIWGWFVNNCLFLKQIYSYKDVNKRLLKYRSSKILEIQFVARSLIKDMHKRFADSIKKIQNIVKVDLLEVMKEIQNLYLLGYKLNPEQLTLKSPAKRINTRGLLNHGHNQENLTLNVQNVKSSINETKKMLKGKPNMLRSFALGIKKVVDNNTSQDNNNVTFNDNTRTNINDDTKSEKEILQFVDQENSKDEFLKFQSQNKINSSKMNVFNENNNENFNIKVNNYIRNKYNNKTILEKLNNSNSSRNKKDPNKNFIKDTSQLLSRLQITKVKKKMRVHNLLKASDSVANESQNYSSYNLKTQIMKKAKNLEKFKEELDEKKLMINLEKLNNNQDLLEKSKLVNQMDKLKSHSERAFLIKSLFRIEDASIQGDLGNYADTKSKVKEKYNCIAKKTMSKDFIQRIYTSKATYKPLEDKASFCIISDGVHSKYIDEFGTLIRPNQARPRTHDHKLNNLSASNSFRMSRRPASLSTNKNKSFTYNVPKSGSLSMSRQDIKDPYIPEVSTNATGDKKKSCHCLHKTSASIDKMSQKKYYDKKRFDVSRKIREVLPEPEYDIQENRTHSQRYSLDKKYHIKKGADYYYGYPKSAKSRVKSFSRLGSREKRYNDNTYVIDTSMHHNILAPKPENNSEYHTDHLDEFGFIKISNV